MRLEPGERVVVRTRAHPRVLLRAAALLVGTALLLGLVMGVLDRPGLPGLVVRSRTWLHLLAWSLAALAVLLGTVRPFLRWLTRRTVITTRRLVQRPGLGRGPEAVMPLVSIADVVRRGRGSGAGDLHVRFQDAGRQVYWRLTDVPEAGRFEEALAEATRRARAQSWPAPHPSGGIR